MKQLAISTDTAKEPKPAARYLAKSRGGVPANRDPVTAPSAIIAVSAIHQGRWAWVQPMPWSVADPSIAPKIHAPGKPILNSKKAARPETDIRNARSPIEPAAAAV